MKLYKVCEIFCSLQGEGFFTGTPAVFLRFSGCNLRCDFCDTDHSDFTEMTADEIVEAMSLFKPRHAVITGGEPGLQFDETLCDKLVSQGWFVQVETNGTCRLPYNVSWVTCSPKAGGKAALETVDELKIVYRGQDVEAICEQFAATNLFLQPCSGQNTAEVIDYVMAHPWWRLSLQTHKLLNIP